MIAQCFEKLLAFAPIVNFEVQGSTIGNIEETDEQVVIRLDKDGVDIACIYKKDGTFEQYSKGTK